jgi:TatD DNase family protein
MNAPLVDLHTHNRDKGDHLKVVSLFLGDSKPKELPFSVGIHPYHANTSLDDLPLRFEMYQEMVAVGEIGLDRTIDIPIDVQHRAFTKQIEIAIARNLPVILHCVKAYADMLSILKRYPNHPFIFHAFDAKGNILESLLKFNCYFSVGMRELTRPKAAERIKKIPTDRLFLETDDGNSPILTVYQCASSLLDTEVEPLAKQLYINYKRLFK